MWKAEVQFDFLTNLCKPLSLLIFARTPLQQFSWYFDDFLVLEQVEGTGGKERLILHIYELFFCPNST